MDFCEKNTGQYLLIFGDPILYIPIEMPTNGHPNALFLSRDTCLKTQTSIFYLKMLLWEKYLSLANIFLHTLLIVSTTSNLLVLKLEGNESGLKGFVETRNPADCLASCPHDAENLFVITQFYIIACKLCNFYS